MTEKDSHFVSERAHRSRIGGPLIGPALLGWITFSVVLVWSVPQLANPWHVMEGYKDGTLPEKSIEVLAMLSPVLMLSALLGFTCFLFITWYFVRIERRYLAIIEKLSAGQE